MILTVRILVILFLSSLLILGAFHEAHAATYKNTWSLFTTISSKKVSYADISVEYSFPNIVQPNEMFEVKVTLTYLSNDNSVAEYLDFYQVAVHIRREPKGPDVMRSSIDSSRLRCNRGKGYDKTFSIRAASDPSDYLVALTWTTYHAVLWVPDPAGILGNFGVGAGENEWDTGSGSLDSARLIVGNEKGTTQRTTTPISSTPILPVDLSNKILTTPVVFLLLAVAGIALLALKRLSGRKTTPAPPSGVISPQSAPTVISPKPSSETKHARAEYERYILRLDELKAQGKISESVYERLRKRFLTEAGQADDSQHK